MVGPTLPDNWASVKAGRRNTTRQEMMNFIVQSGECRKKDTIYFSMIIEHVILILEKAASYRQYLTAVVFHRSREMLPVKRNCVIY